MSNAINFRVSVDAAELTRLAGTVKGLGSGFLSLRGIIRSIGVNDMASGFDRSHNSLTGMLTTANLLADAIKGIASSGLNLVGGQLKKGSKSQIEQISFSGALSAQLDMAFKDAEKLANEVTTMSAKAAAALPGETEDYVAIATQSFDDIAAIYKAQGKSIQDATKGFKPMLENWGIMATSVGVDGQRAGQDLNRLINGNLSFAQLRRLEIFQKNPLFMKQLQKFSAEMGVDVKNLKNIDIGKRLEIVQKAIAAAIPPEALEKLKTTVEGQWQSWKSSLLDTTSGLFGFMRNLNQRSGKTLMSAIGLFMSKITDAVNVFGGAFPAFIDPMVALFDLFTNLGKGIDRIVKGFQASKYVKTLLDYDKFKDYDSGGKSLDTKDLGRLGLLQYTVDWGGMISEKIVEIVKKISDFILNAPLTISKTFDMATIGNTLGKMVANGINKISQILGSTRLGDYSSKLTANFSLLFSNIIEGISGFISNLGSINFSGFGVSLAKILSSVADYVSKINFGSLSQVVGSGISLVLSGVMGLVNGYLSNLNFSALGRSIGNFVEAIVGVLSKINFGSALSLVGSSVSSALNGLMSLVMGLLGKLNFSTLGFTIGKTIGDLLSGLTIALFNILSKTNWSGVVSVAGKLVLGLGQILIGAVAGLVASLITNLPGLIMGSLGALLNLVVQLGQGIVIGIGQLITNPINLLGTALFSIGQIIFTVVDKIFNITPIIQNLTTIVSNIGSGFNLVIELIRGIFINALENISRFFGSILSTVQSSISGARSSIFDVISNTITNIQSIFSEWFTSLMDGIKSKLASIPGISNILSGLGIAPTAATTPTTTPTVTTTAPTAPAANLPATGTKPNTAAPATGAVSSSAASEIAGLKVQRAAKGLNFSNLLTAASIESKDMPTGANLVMANSSELIIPRSNIQTVDRSQEKSNNNISLSINISGAGSPQAVADNVVQQISLMFKEYKLINGMA